MFSCRGEDVAERLVQRVLGLPAGRRMDLGGIADEARDVDRADEVRVLDEPELPPCVREELVGDLGDGHAPSGTDVVDLAGVAVLGEQPVGAHDVAHVVQVAHGVERADGDLVGAGAFGGRDAVRERGDEEVR